jgi:hypothetical protein
MVRIAVSILKYFITRKKIAQILDLGCHFLVIQQPLRWWVIKFLYSLATTQVAKYFLI